MTSKSRCLPHRSLAYVNSEGYHVIGWTVDSRDWNDDITADAIYQRVVEHVCPGAIIAFHDVNPANVAALPRLLDYLGLCRAQSASIRLYRTHV